MVLSGKLGYTIHCNGNVCYIKVLMGMNELIKLFQIKFQKRVLFLVCKEQLFKNKVAVDGCALNLFCSIIYVQKNKVK